MVVHQSKQIVFLEIDTLVGAHALAVVEKQCQGWSACFGQFELWQLFKKPKSTLVHLPSRTWDGLSVQWVSVEVSSLLLLLLAVDGWL